MQDSTRLKVLHVAEQMGYHPKVWAQNLANRKSNQITVISPVLSNYFFMEVLAGMQDRLQDAEFDLNIFNIRNANELAETVETRIKRGLSDGFVLISTHLSNEQLSRIKKLNAPVVLVDDYHALFDSVSCDNVEGAFNATQHLIDSGYERIGLISALTSSQPARERVTGYKNAIQQAGRLIDPALMYLAPDKERDGFTEKTGFDGLTALLTSENPPEACFVTSDIQGIGAMKAMEALGKKIPLVCFDDIEIAAYFNLTTMRQPLYQFGAMAVDLLLKRLEEPDVEIKHTVFSPRLIERN